MAVFSLFQKHLNPAVSLLEISNAMATATISLFGGQVLRYKPKRDGRERLFLSDAALFDGTKSIRGGVPICWPWFGAHPTEAKLPAHGVARTKRWYLAAVDNSLQGSRLLLLPEDISHPAVPAHVGVELEIMIGEQLEIRLHSINRSNKDVPLNCALHSYFAVSDIAAVQLDGLKGQYSDKTKDWERFETPSPYVIEAETDRIHLDPAERVVLKDPQGETHICSKGHDSIVVWNPWNEAHTRFPDLTPDDYRHMLCVETALTQPFILSPDSSHVLTQIIE